MPAKLLRCALQLVLAAHIPLKNLIDSLSGTQLQKITWFLLGFANILFVATFSKAERFLRHCDVCARASIVYGSRCRALLVSHTCCGRGVTFSSKRVELTALGNL